MSVTPQTKPFPDVPKTFTFQAWYKWAVSVAEWANQFVFDFDIPGRPTGFTVEPRPSAFQLRWNMVPKAKSYVILRGTESDPFLAAQIGRQVGRDNISYLDVVDAVSLQYPSLYYWVVAENSVNQRGPLSEMIQTNNQALPGGVAGLPFGGPTGNGMDGLFYLGASTTSTVEIPIFQFTSFTIPAGVTWTAYPNNPGGFSIAVTGRCTIAGTIDVDGRGGTGGYSTSAGASFGYNGQIGFQFGGSGAGGGASSSLNGKGGHGGPQAKEYPYGSYNVGGTVRQSSQASSWYGSTGAIPTETELRTQSQTNVVGSGAGAFSEAFTGGNGTAVTAFPGLNALFPAMWTFFRSLMFGWGGGGGSGGTDNTADGGAGGNGGGFVVIMCEELDFTGTINARGAAGQNGQAGGGLPGAGGGGGGGGGGVFIGYRRLIANTGTINVGGGVAGTGGSGFTTGSDGGTGGTGYSKVFAMRI